METGETLEADSFEYDGEVAKCGGGGAKASKPQAFYSTASQLVGGVAQPLMGAISKDIITNPFLDRSSDLYKQSVADIRGGYGARGLEGSGIAIKGEQQALQKIVNEAGAQRAGQLTGILQTASGSPSVATPQQQQGRGFMGMK